MFQRAGARAEVAAVQNLAEVCAGNDLGRQRALVGKVLQRRAQQADAVRRQRALAKLVNDAERPALSKIIMFHICLPAQHFVGSQPRPRLTHDGLWSTEHVSASQVCVSAW